MKQKLGDKKSRKHLKDDLYKNNEFLPLFDPLDLDNGQETPVWLIIPFPGLHKVLLGPVIHAVDALKEFTEKEFDNSCVWNAMADDNNDGDDILVEKYLKNVGITRSQYFNRKLEGNECQKFIHKKILKKFQDLLVSENI